MPGVRAFVRVEVPGIGSKALRKRIPGFLLRMLKKKVFCDFKEATV